MKMKKNLSLLLFAFISIFTTGCVNIAARGTEKVTVIESATGKPISGVPFVYHYVKKPYLIAGRVVESKPYVSNENGVVMIPKYKSMFISHESEWKFDTCVGKAESELNDSGIYYLEKKEPNQTEVATP